MSTNLDRQSPSANPFYTFEENLERGKEGFKLTKPYQQGQLYLIMVQTDLFQLIHKI